MLRAQESQWWLGAPGSPEGASCPCFPCQRAPRTRPEGHTPRVQWLPSLRCMTGGRGRDNSEKVLNRLLPHSQHQVSLQTIAKRKQVPTNTSMFRKLPPVCYFVTVFRWTGHMETGQAIVQYKLCPDLGYYLALHTSNIWFRSWSCTLPLNGHISCWLIA